MSEQERYYYRIASDTTVGKQLNYLYSRAVQATNAASALAKELGADFFEPSTGCMAGGINCFYFLKRPSARRWEILKRTPDKLYAAIPNTETKSGEKVLQKLSQLPIVRVSEVAKALNLDMGKQNQHTKMPLMFPIDNAYSYICSDYSLNVEGMETVTEEEWNSARAYYESASRDAEHKN